MEIDADGKPVATTQWRVITGAPSSGKTAVIRRLARMGCPVVHEAARALIEEELEKGQTLQAIKADALQFERRILYRKVEIEAQLRAEDRVYLDRAVPDSIAYYRFEDLDSSEPEHYSRLVRYHRVFFFDRLGFAADAVRSENDQSAIALERLLESSYRDLGYDLIRVPVMPVEQRAKWVLEHK